MAGSSYPKTFYFDSLTPEMKALPSFETSGTITPIKQH